MSTSTQIFELLKAAGLPVEGVGIESVEKQEVTVQWPKGVSDDDLRAADQILEAFDWSPEAEKKYELDSIRKGTVDSADESSKNVLLLKAAILFLIKQLTIAVPEYKGPTLAEITDSLKTIVGNPDELPATAVLSETLADASVHTSDGVR